MSTQTPNVVMSEELVAQRIKVGDKINGHVVTEKVWTRDTPGNCKVHVVYVDGNQEAVVELDPKVSFAMVEGLVSTNEVFNGKRVQAQFSGDSGGWVATRSDADLVDITQLKS